jgi:hypothetical protein
MKTTILFADIKVYSRLLSISKLTAFAILKHIPIYVLIYNVLTA